MRSVWVEVRTHFAVKYAEKSYHKRYMVISLTHHEPSESHWYNMYMTPLGCISILFSLILHSHSRRNRGPFDIRRVQLYGKPFVYHRYISLLPSHNSHVWKRHIYRGMVILQSIYHSTVLISFAIAVALTAAGVVIIMNISATINYYIIIIKISSSASSMFIIVMFIMFTINIIIITDVIIIFIITITIIMSIVIIFIFL